MSTAAIQKMVNPIEEMLLAEQQLAAAWETYKQAEPHGLAFGKVLCEWRDRFGAQGSRKGAGLRPILDKVGIPPSTAYFWMDRYEVSAGLKKAKEKPDETTVEPTADDDDVTNEPKVPAFTRVAPDRMVRLQAAAAAAGKTVEDVVGELIDTYLAQPDVLKSIELMDSLATVESVATELVHDGQPKVELDVNELKNVLKRLGVVLHDVKTPQLVRITSPHGRATLTAVAENDELTITLSKARTFGDFKVTVLHDILSAAVKNMSGSITFTADGTIQAGAFTAKVRCVDASVELLEHEILPPLNSIKGIDLAGFKNQYKHVRYAIPPADGKFVAPHALVQSTVDRLRMVTTDSLRLAISERPAIHGEDLSFVIPQPALERLLGMNGEQLIVAETATYFEFSTEIERMTYGKTHAEFPAYHRCLPINHGGWSRVTVDAGMLAAALRRLRPHCGTDVLNGGKDGVIFTFADRLKLDALMVERTPHGDVTTLTAHEVVSAVIVGPSRCVRLNADFVLQFLEQVNGLVEFFVKEHNKVVDFSSGGLRYLLMPMRWVGDAPDAAVQKEIVPATVAEPVPVTL